jgi:hypothetical protein
MGAPKLQSPQYVDEILFRVLAEWQREQDTGLVIAEVPTNVIEITRNKMVSLKNRQSRVINQIVTLDCWIEFESDGLVVFRMADFRYEIDPLDFEGFMIGFFFCLQNIKVQYAGINSEKAL